MSKYRTGSHTKTRLTVHLFWSTKYRYKVLSGEVQKRCRELMIQDCKSTDIEILKGVVSKDHVHIHIECPPKLSISLIMKQLKGRSSRLIQKEFPHLIKQYWGQRFWGRGYGGWSTGNVTDEMIPKYLDHHNILNEDDNDKFLLEG